MTKKQSIQTTNMSKVTGNNSYPVPLKCILCPKKPQFSDVSHLLTHVSSKSHLSHQLTSTLKAPTDPDVFQRTQEYEHWYQIYGIAGLLAERMTTKENKKNKVKGKKIKVENEGDNDNIHPGLYNLAPGQPYRAPVPLMQPLMPRNIVPWRSAYHPNQDRPAPDWAASSLYGTPTMRSNVPNFITYQPDAEDSDDSDDSDDDEEEDQEKHRVSAAAQLKGIHWPGMGLFDAATPLQKRQRNQKKDGSILRQLISTSKNLQPIEVVYDGTLNEIKSRDIDTLGEDSDEGSLKRRSSPPVKRRGRGRTALKKVDGNAPRKFMPARKSKGLAKNRLASVEEDEPQIDNIIRPFGTSTLSNSRLTSSRNTTPAAKLEANTEENDDFFQLYRANKKIPVYRAAEHAGHANIETEDVLSHQDSESWTHGERTRAGTESPLEEHRFGEMDERSQFLEDHIKRATDSPPLHSYFMDDDKYPSGKPGIFDDGLGPDHLDVTGNPKESAQGGFRSSSSRFIPGFAHGHQQYYHDAPTINPLNAQMAQNPYAPFGYHLARGEPSYAYPAAAQFAGEFKPLLNSDATAYYANSGLGQGSAEQFSNQNENAAFHT